MLLRDRKNAKRSQMEQIVDFLQTIRSQSDLSYSRIAKQLGIEPRRAKVYRDLLLSKGFILWKRTRQSRRKRLSLTEKGSDWLNGYLALQKEFYPIVENART